MHIVCMRVLLYTGFYTLFIISCEPSLPDHSRPQGRTPTAARASTTPLVNPTSEFGQELPIVDLHNDRSFYLSARQIAWQDCKRASICAARYQNMRFFFSLWRPPQKIGRGLPWRLTRTQAKTINQLSHFAYLKMAITDLESIPNIRISNSPPDLGPGSQRVVFLGVEGAYLLNDRADRKAESWSNIEKIIKQLKEKQVAYIALTWSNPNRFCGVAGEKIGLKRDGKQLVRLLLQNQILIDLSHASDRCVHDFYKYTRGQYPLFYSHSAVRNLCQHKRNLDDTLLKLAADSGGVVGINFYTRYLACSSTAHQSDVVKHLVYIKDRYGSAHIAFGSDYDGFIRLPHGMRSPGAIQDLKKILIKHGFSQADLEALYYKNAKRVLQKAQTLDASIL